MGEMTRWNFLIEGLFFILILHKLEK